MNSTLRLIPGLFAIAAVAFSADNTIGTWKLNPEKSKQAAGIPRITNLTLIREAAGDGFRTTARGEREDKSKIDITFTGKYDGKEVSRKGRGLPYDTVAVRQVDASTLTDVRTKKGGAYRATGRFEVSKDGKTATLTTKGTGADGKPFSSMTFYEKQ